MTGAAIPRRRFLQLAGGSVAAAALLAACGDGGASIDTSEFGEGDIGILNFALALEHVNSAFYAALIEAKVLAYAPQELSEWSAVQEEEHVVALSKEVKKLGGKPVAPPETSFSFDDEEDAMAQVDELENAIAAGYLGQLLKVKGEAAQNLMIAIHTVEARHAASFAHTQHQSAMPDGAFAKPISEDEALEVAADFVS
jgi:rubrerythrin